jgi:hypothetical protein
MSNNGQTPYGQVYYFADIPVTSFTGDKKPRGTTCKNITEMKTPTTGGDTQCMLVGAGNIYNGPHPVLPLLIAGVDYLPGEKKNNLTEKFITQWNNKYTGTKDQLDQLESGINPFIQLSELPNTYCT